MAIIHEMNPDLHIEVFAHKAESLAEDYRLGVSCTSPKLLFVELNVRPFRELPSVTRTCLHRDH